MTLEIQTGPQAGKRIELRPGRIVQVGRTSWADLSVPGDALLSAMHFILECGAGTCRVRDQGTPSGTYLNGTRVNDAVVRDGDQIVAGGTIFVVRIGSTEPGNRQNAALEIPVTTSRSAKSAPSAGHDLLQLLRALPEPLFALLDAARDPQVLQRLGESREERQSLYEGKEGELLASFAPYLVSLPAPSPLLETLARDAWGQSWGVYLTCTQPFKEVRRHFRHFLLVQSPEGEELYFRFYDPRVLPAFLNNCLPQEIKEFFGPISCFLMEGAKPNRLLKFTSQPHGVNQEAVLLSGAQQGQQPAGVHATAL